MKHQATQGVNSFYMIMRGPEWTKMQTKAKRIQPEHFQIPQGYSPVWVRLIPLPHSSYTDH